MVFGLILTDTALKDLDEAPEDDASSSDYETAPSRRSL